jgi:hypothetical protein
MKNNSLLYYLYFRHYVGCPIVNISQKIANNKTMNCLQGLGIRLR